MSLDKTEVMDNRDPASPCRRVLRSLLSCTGDMEHLDKYIADKPFVMQMAVSCLRGVSRVSLSNNPMTGAIILIALAWASPWQCLLGSLGVLASTLTAVIIGQDSVEVSAGVYSFNGMLVSLLIGVYSSAGDWYWWLLIPVCLASATSVFFFSAISSVFHRWELPVAVYPFNITIVLYLLCVTPDNPYFPHNLATPPGQLEPNCSELIGIEVMRGIPLAVGQFFGCGTLGPSLLILAAVLLYSPLLAAYALLGSTVGTIAGLSMAVRHDSLYSGLSGLNGLVGCMSIGLFCTFCWRTHLLAIACAFLSAYADIALSNLFGTVGLPACSWAAVTAVTVLLLLSGSLAAYKVPLAKIRAPEHNLHLRSQ